MNVNTYKAKISQLLGPRDPLTGREAATRFVGVAALLLVGYLHLMDISHKIEEGVWYMAFLFTTLIVASVLLAVALIRADRSKVRFVWVGAAGLAVGAMFGYFVSRALPMPQMADHQGDWFNGLGIIAGLVEVGLVFLAGFALRDRVLRRQSAPRTRRRAGAAAPAMSMLMVLFMQPAMALAHGGEEMTPEEMRATEMGHDPASMDHSSMNHDPLLGGTELNVILALALCFLAWAGFALRARVEPGGRPPASTRRPRPQSQRGVSPA